MYSSPNSSILADSPDASTLKCSRNGDVTCATTEGAVTSFDFDASRVDDLIILGSNCYVDGSAPNKIAFIDVCEPGKYICRIDHTIEDPIETDILEYMALHESDWSYSPLVIYSSNAATLTGIIVQSNRKEGCHLWRPAVNWFWLLLAGDWNFRFRGYRAGISPTFPTPWYARPISTDTTPLDTDTDPI